MVRCTTAKPTAWRRFDEMLSLAPRALALLTDELDIVEGNGALATMFATNRTALRGRPLSDFVILDRAGDGGDPFRGPLDRARGSYIGWGLQDGCRRRVTLWRVAAGTNGARRGAMAMVEAVEEEYQQVGPEWEQAELVQLRRVAAIMAHEVRNPLTGMGGALQVIKERMARDAPDRPVIDEIQKRLYALNAVVDRLQEYATVQHPRLQTVSIREILGRSIEMLDEDGRFGAVTVQLQGDDVTVQGDYALLVRLFFSLLVNAAQSSGCAAVTVTVTAAKSTCRVSILDDGPGIGDTERDLVFLPFFTTRSQGLGLGLATARRIAASHGGRVWCASGTASGTEMVVGLPACG